MKSEHENMGASGAWSMERGTWRAHPSGRGAADMLNGPWPEPLCRIEAANGDGRTIVGLSRRKK